MNTNQPSHKIHDDYIKLAYQTALDDIRFFKRQQWMVTNYAVLIYGAIIAAANLIIKSAGICWFLVVTGCIAIFSFLLVIQLQCSTQNARNRKDKALILAVDQKMIRKKEQLDGKSPSRCMEFFDKYSVILLLTLVILGGGCFTTFILFYLRCKTP